jgi:hypothetical protein
LSGKNPEYAQSKAAQHMLNDTGTKKPSLGSGFSDGFSEVVDHATFNARYAALTRFLDGLLVAVFPGLRDVDETVPKVPKDEAKISRCAANQCPSALPSWQPSEVHK